MTKKVPGAKRGRPPVEKPKGYMFGVRLDEDMRAAVEQYRENGHDLAEEVRAFIKRRLKAEGLL